jgi:hypothetical protein
MSQPVFWQRWDIAKLAEAMLLSPAEARAFFVDGRRGGFLLEGAVRDRIGGRLAPGMGAPYDVIGGEGDLWEVRALTAGGVRFNPSNQRGSMRSYSEGAFLAKLAGIKGFYVADLTRFPDVPFYLLLSPTVRDWHRAGRLHEAHLTYRQAQALFAG